MVSVLINNYNYANYIGEAIQSVLKQTYTEWELIIVDDGSKDTSREVIEEYVKRYPDKIIAICKENGGQASAMNAGFSKAKGDIIAFLDSDDYWYPDKLEKIVEAHKEHDYVVNNFDTNGPEKSLCDWEHMEQSSALLKKYGYRVLVSAPTSSISFTRKVLEHVFPIPEPDYRISADGFIDLCALYFTDYYYIEEPLTFYRFHNLNGYYGKENTYDVKNFLYKLVLNVNDKISQENLSPIPIRTMETQKNMYKEVDHFSLESGMRYIIYGAGDIGLHVLKLAHMQNAQIVCFCDKAPEKFQEGYQGYPVIGPQELVVRRKEYDKIIIASTFYREEIRMMLHGLGFTETEDYISTSLFTSTEFTDMMDKK